MMPSAASTAACGMGKTRSIQMRAMPRAHAQLSYLRSVSTASLASWAVGIVAQAVSVSDRTPITIKPGLKRGLRTLQPAAHAGQVAPVGIAEPPFQVRLLPRDHAVADRDRQGQRQDQRP